MISLSARAACLHLALVTCICLMSQPINAKPAMFDDKRVRTALASQDYLDLQAILGKSLPGTPAEKSKVIDLLLQLLAEIDLPTLCNVIRNDTSFNDAKEDVITSEVPVSPTSFKTSVPQPTPASTEETLVQSPGTEDDSQIDQNVDGVEISSNEITAKGEKGEKSKENALDVGDYSENTTSSQEATDSISDTASVEDVTSDSLTPSVPSPTKPDRRNINTDGALPFPISLRRRNGALIQRRIIRNRDDLKKIGLPAKYSASMPLKLMRRRKLGKSSKKGNYFIRSVGVRKPKASLYSQNLILGDWMDDHSPKKSFAIRNAKGQLLRQSGVRRFTENDTEEDAYTDDDDESIVKDTKLGRRVMLVVRKGGRKKRPGRRVVYRRRKTTSASAAASRGPVQYSVLKQVRTPLSETQSKAGKRLVKKRYFLPRESLKQRLHRAKGDRFGAGGHRIVRNGGIKRRVLPSRPRVFRVRADPQKRRRVKTSGDRMSHVADKQRVAMKAVDGGVEEYRIKGDEPGNENNYEQEDDVYTYSPNFEAISKERTATPTASSLDFATSTTLKVPGSSIQTTSMEYTDNNEDDYISTDAIQPTQETSGTTWAILKSTSQEIGDEDDYLKEITESDEFSEVQEWIDSSEYERIIEEEENMADPISTSEPYYNESPEIDAYSNIVTKALELEPTEETTVEEKESGVTSTSKDKNPTTENKHDLDREMYASTTHSASRVDYSFNATNRNSSKDVETSIELEEDTHLDSNEVILTSDENRIMEQIGTEEMTASTREFQTSSPSMKQSSTTTLVTETSSESHNDDVERKTEKEDDEYSEILNHSSQRTDERTSNEIEQPIRNSKEFTTSATDSLLKDSNSLEELEYNNTLKIEDAMKIQLGKHLDDALNATDSKNESNISIDWLIKKEGSVFKPDDKEIINSSVNSNDNINKLNKNNNHGNSTSDDQYDIKEDEESSSAIKETTTVKATPTSNQLLEESLALGNPAEKMEFEEIEVSIDPFMASFDKQKSNEKMEGGVTPTLKHTTANIIIQTNSSINSDNILEQTTPEIANKPNKGNLSLEGDLFDNHLNLSKTDTDASNGNYSRQPETNELQTNIIKNDSSTVASIPDEIENNQTNILKENSTFDSVNQRHFEETTTSNEIPGAVAININLSNQSEESSPVLIKPSFIEFLVRRDENKTAMNEPASLSRFDYEISSSTELPTSTEALSTSTSTTTKTITTTNAMASKLNEIEGELKEDSRIDYVSDAKQDQNQTEINLPSISDIDIVSTSLKRSGQVDMGDQYASLTREEDQSNLTLDAMMNTTTEMNAVNEQNQSYSVLRTILTGNKTLTLFNKTNVTSQPLDATNTESPFFESNTDSDASSTLPSLLSNQTTQEQVVNETQANVTYADILDRDADYATYAPVSNMEVGVSQTASPSSMVNMTASPVSTTETSTAVTSTTIVRPLDIDLDSLNQSGEEPDFNENKTSKVATLNETFDATTSTSGSNEPVGIDKSAGESAHGIKDNESEGENRLTTATPDTATTIKTNEQETRMAWEPIDIVKKFGDPTGYSSTGFDYWNKPESSAFRARFTDWIGPDGRTDYSEPKSNSIDLWKAYNIALTDKDRLGDKENLKPEDLASPAGRNYMWGAQSGETVYENNKMYPYYGNQAYYDNADIGFNSKSVDHHSFSDPKAEAVKPIPSNNDYRQQAHVRDWGNRFSQGFYGRVYDEREPTRSMFGFNPLNRQRFNLGNKRYPKNNFQQNYKPNFNNENRIQSSSKLGSENVKSPQITVAQQKESKDFSDEDMRGLWYESKASVHNRNFGKHFDNGYDQRELPRRSKIQPTTARTRSYRSRISDRQSSDLTDAAGFDPKLNLGPVGDAAPNDFVCPGLFGYHSDPEDCQAFFICSWTVPYRLHCPSGTRWNPQNSVCDWAVNVPCPRHDSRSSAIFDSTEYQY